MCAERISRHSYTFLFLVHLILSNSIDYKWKWFENRENVKVQRIWQKRWLILRTVMEDRQVF